MSKFSLRGASLAAMGGVLVLSAAIGLAAPHVAKADDCIRALPSATATSPEIQSGTVGETRTFTMTLTNNDSVGCFASEFTSAANLPFDWNGGLTPSGTLVLAPQESMNYTIDAIPSPIAQNGTYDVGIDFLQHYTDPAIPNDYFGFTKHYTYKVVGSPYNDTIAPTVTITKPTEGANIKKGSTTLIEAHATDNIEVTGMTYSINGVTQCSVVFPLCTWQPTARGTYTIVVTAHDSAGNVGSDTVTVRVR